MTTSSSRQLALLECFFIGLNSLLGAGIFVVPAQIARIAGPSAMVAVLLTGGMSLLVALCLAEAAARTNRTGGPCRYARDAFGPSIGAAVGWISVIGSSLSQASLLCLLGQSLSTEFGFQGTPVVELSLALISGVSLGVSNMLGTRLSARIGIIAGVVTAFCLLMLSVTGLFLPAVSQFLASQGSELSPHQATGLGAALSSSMYILCGFELIPVLGGDTMQPTKTLPRATILSVSCVAGLYLLVQYVVGKAASISGDLSSIQTHTAGSFIEEFARTLLRLGKISGLLGLSMSVALVSPRYLEVLAHDRMLPLALSARSRRFGTPVAAVMLQTGIVLVLLSLVPKLPSEPLAYHLTSVSIAIQCMAACAALPVLRRRAPAPPGRFALPMGSLAAVVAVCLLCIPLIHSGTDTVMTWLAYLVVACIAHSYLRDLWYGEATRITNLL